MNEKMGNVIKHLRLSKKMTLKELGDKAGLSVGYLSSLERGLCSASLVSLQNIAEALEVDSSTLMTPRVEKKNAIVRSYDRVAIRIGESRMIHQYLIDTNELPCHPVVPVLVTLLPGQDIKNIVPYSHSGEEFIYVLEGVLTLLLNGRCYFLHPGDSVHFEAALLHEWGNDTDKLVRLLAVNTEINYSIVSNIKLEKSKL